MEQLVAQREVSDIIVWTLEKVAENYLNNTIVIPPVQRGLIWNAVRCEVLWDSLMRGIPIGFLSVREICENQNKWDLLDGQQRVNAISMAYVDFPSSYNQETEREGKEQEKQRSILWLDLCPPNIKSERKFYFMVTTASQPWGYNITMDERSNNRLSISERRQAIDDIQKNWEKSNNQAAKPYPFELYPKKARMAFPFSVIRKYIEKNLDSTFDDFMHFCSNQYEKCNWMKKVRQNVESGFTCHCWNEIKQGIKRINATSITATIIRFDDDSDIGIFFQRLNKSGYEASSEEIYYSRLKARIPALKEIDKLAKDLMPASRLAHIALLLFNSNEYKRCVTNVSSSDISLLCAGGDGSIGHKFGHFIDNQLGALLNKTKELMCFSRSNSIGLPRVIYTSIPCDNPCLFHLLLKLVESNSDSEPEELSRFLISLSTYILLWCKKQIRNYDSKITQVAYGIFHNFDFVVDKESLCSCLYELIKKDFLSLPPVIVSPSSENSLGISSRITKKSWFPFAINNIKNFDFCLNHTFDLSHLWHWQSEQGRCLLLYAVRDYIYKTFSDYTPFDGRWDEESRPWDYDHIFPRDWINESNNSSIVPRFIDSIGNIAPIPLSQNRGKSDSPPGDYLKDDNSMLFVAPSETFGSLENFKKDQSQSFIDFVMTRFSAFLRKWYNDLQINDILDFSTIIDNRRCLFSSIREKKKGTTVFFTHKDGRQYKIDEKSVDWARPWLAIGIECNDDNSVYPAIAWGGDTDRIEVGLRRHPNKSNIDGNDIWYINSRCKYIKFNKNNIEETINTLIRMLEELTSIQSDQTAYSKWLEG